MNIGSRRPPFSAFRLGTVPLIIVLSSGCAAGASAPAPPPPPLTGPAELASLHDALRVPGLEDRSFDHATYWRVMEPFLNGPVATAEVGRSAEGRSIRRLTVGSGPVTVLLWSQMHGDESTASMSLVDVIRFFHDQPDHPLARRITEGATVHFVPMLNPDGAQRFRRRNAQGIDVNRDARRLQTPEGRLLKALSDDLAPDFGFNLHDQSVAVRVGSSDRGVAIALLAPAFNEARDVDEKRHRAMQVASVLVGAMRPLVTDHIAQYDDTFNPRAFGDLIGAWGASTVLIESGGWPGDPQKQHLRKTNFVGILSALDAIATGSYRGFDPAAYTSLDFNGRRVPDLLIVGGTLAVPGIAPLKADLLVNYDRPLLREGGVIADIGDLGESQAQDTLDVAGLYLVPLPEALDAQGGIDTGAPAHFVVAEDPQGLRVRFRFAGGPPKPEE
jgi:hypothetical protein